MKRFEQGIPAELQGSNDLESRERNTGLHFLVVEDNSENIQAAQAYLNQRGDELTRITADFVPDHDGAEQHLQHGRYNWVITDLFFPKKLGSNDVSLGQKSLQRLSRCVNSLDLDVRSVKMQA